MTSSRLLQTTQHLVRQRPRELTFSRISKATRISVSWLKQFSQGKIAEPSVQKTEALYSFLANKPLEI